MNVEQAIRRAAATLRDAGVDTPEHDAKLLLAEACGCSLSDVDKAMLLGKSIAALAEEHSAEGVSPAPSVEGVPERRFDAMLARRAAREPLQYIVGHAPFRYLDLAVGPGVFIPRPETELVVQEGLDWLAVQRITAPRVVDLCAGSGAIGLSIVTETADAEVWAVELSERTAAWTRPQRRSRIGNGQNWLRHGPPISSGARGCRRFQRAGRIGRHRGSGGHEPAVCTRIGDPRTARGARL